MNHNVRGIRASVTWGGRSRSTGFSSACAQTMFQNDIEFMNKISEALEVVYENFGATAIEQITVLDEEKGEADVDVDLLARMMEQSKIKIRNECCSMFFSSKSILGSFSYLFGSISFGAMTYFTFNPVVEALVCFFGASMYLIGGTIYIMAALEPWVEKTKHLNTMCGDIQELRVRGKLVRQMTGQGLSRTNPNSSARVKTRMSKLNIDTKALFVPNERDEELMQEEDGSDDLYSLVSSHRDSQISQCSMQSTQNVGINISFNPSCGSQEERPSHKWERAFSGDSDTNE